MRLVSIGEIIWDVIGNREYLGGAPLNFAAHIRQLGHEVALVSAVGDDPRGRLALDSLHQRGIVTKFVSIVPGRPTGIAEVELDTEGKPSFSIRRPAAYDFVSLSSQQIEAVGNFQPDWIYFGSLYHTSQSAVALTERILQAAPAARRFYDVNLRDGQWGLAMVERLSSQATVVKLSDSEAEFLDGSLNAGGQEGSAEHFCRRWSHQYDCETICVTLGERGCAIFHDGEYCEIGGYPVDVADTVGTGDAFSAAFVHGLQLGWELSLIGRFANAVAALVASRPGATPEWHPDECQAMLGPEAAARTSTQPLGGH